MASGSEGSLFNIKLFNCELKHRCNHYKYNLIINRLSPTCIKDVHTLKHYFYFSLEILVLRKIVKKY